MPGEISTGREAKMGIPPVHGGKVIRWDPTRGGMITPHLHYGGEMYMLSDARWAAFSKDAMRAVADKLGKVQRVTFDQVMDLSDTVTQMH